MRIYAGIFGVARDVLPNIWQAQPWVWTAKLSVALRMATLETHVGTYDVVLVAELMPGGIVEGPDLFVTKADGGWRPHVMVCDIVVESASSPAMRRTMLETLLQSRGIVAPWREDAKLSGERAC